MRYRISILYILPAQHHILHKSHYIYLCFGYTVDIPNLGPWSPLITQAMVQQALYDKAIQLKCTELRVELQALGAVTTGRKDDLLDRLVALQLEGQHAAGRQTTAEAIQIAPPAAAAIQTAVEATAAASAEPAEVAYNTETQDAVLSFALWRWRDAMCIHAGARHIRIYGSQLGGGTYGSQMACFNKASHCPHH